MTAFPETKAAWARLCASVVGIFQVMKQREAVRKRMKQIMKELLK